MIAGGAWANQQADGALVRSQPNPLRLFAVNATRPLCLQFTSSSARAAVDLVVHFFFSAGVAAATDQAGASSLLTSNLLKSDEALLTARVSGGVLAVGIAAATDQPDGPGARQERLPPGGCRRLGPGRRGPPHHQETRCNLNPVWGKRVSPRRYTLKGIGHLFNPVENPYVPRHVLQ